MPDKLVDILLPEEGDSKSGRKDELTREDVLADFKRAHEARKKLMDAMKEDHEFKLGKQWDQEDVEKLKKIGVRALTINKIAPIVDLLRGIETQNRADFRAYPEGEEDTLASEIVTRLMKNALKNSKYQFKQTEMFDAGVTAGESFLEPWLHYPYRVKPDGSVDLTANLNWRHTYYDSCYPDPAAKEYDYSDARYFCKFTTDLSKEELISMFPDKKDDLEEVEAGGKINLDAISLDRDQTGVDVQKRGYEEEGTGASWIPKGGYDLLDYYYKKWVPCYYVADFKLKKIVKVKNKRAGQRYVDQATKRDVSPKKPSAKLIERLQPEIWVAFLTGRLDDFLAHGPAWSFPNWKSWPIFRYACYVSGAPVDPDDRALLVQGLTRRSKDLNRELDKRRTQELRHLNQSTNSGWTGEENAFVDEDKWENFGSSTGVILKWKGIEPHKILPTPLSQGHAQMVEEHTQDMRESLGIDREALAMQSSGDSGRAILARQKQAMLMVAGVYDNLAQTRYDVGRFTLAVLPEIYDVEKAMRVLGSAFLQKNFQKPAIDPTTGQPAIDPRTMAPMMQYDEATAQQTINQVLTDAELGVFDVAVGDNISNETIQLAEYMEVKDLAETTGAVPPDVLVESSTISESKKKRILSSLQAAAAAQQQPAVKSKPKVK